jgi:hypothetical protein
MAESHREEIAKLEALYANNPGGRVFVHLAEALRRAGEHERARAILDEGLTRHGDSASGYVVRGRVLLDLGEHDAAIGAFRRVLELDPGNLVALRGLGDAAQRTGWHDEAVRYYAELQSRSPFDEEIRGLLTDAEAMAAAARAAVTESIDEPWSEAEPYRDWPMPEPEGPESVSEPADQPAAPYSAAPGTSGDAVAAEPDFGLIDLERVTGEIPVADVSAFLMDDDDAGPAPDVSDLFEVPSDASLAEVRLEGGPEADVAEYAEFDVELELARPDAAQPYEFERAAGPAGDLDLGRFEDAPPAPLGEQEVVERPTEPSAAELLAVEMRQWGRRGETADTDAGLVTETMADLYMSQGFHERAAEVYRTLLQRRPDDAALAAKLATAQSARTAAAAPDAGEEWLRGTVWTAEQATQDAPTPYTWTAGEPDEEAEAAQPIGEYLRSLLAWQAGASATETDAPDPADAGSSPADADHGWIRAAETSAWEQGPYESADPKDAGETEHAAEGGWSQMAGEELAEGGWTQEPEAWVAGADGVEDDAAELWRVELDTPAGGYGASDADASAGSDAAAEADRNGAGEEEPAAEAESQPAAPSSEADGEPWSFVAESSADEPWADTGTAAEPWAEAPVEEPREGDPIAADPWSSVEPQPAGGDPWSEAGEREVDSEVEPWSTMPEPGQWTQSTPATEPSVADLTSAAGSPPRRDPNAVETAFEEWYGGAEAEPKPDAAAERQRQEEEDEDLAMFRAWLQSLKK